MQTNPPASAPGSSSALRHPGGKRGHGCLSEPRAASAKVVISPSLWPGEQRGAGGRGEAPAKPEPQIRWFLILLLPLKPLAMALQGKGEAEWAAGRPVHARPTSEGISPSPLFTHHPPGQRMLGVKHRAQLASSQRGFTPLPRLTLPGTPEWLLAAHGRMPDLRR